MNWQLILKKIKEHGYSGGESDLAAVKAYVSEHFAGVKDAEGKAIDLDALHAKAFPTLTIDAKDAENAALREELEVLKTANELLGAHSPERHKNKAIQAEIKVGKDRFEDDPKAGFKSFGHFIQAVYTAGGTGDRANAPAPDSSLGKWQKSYAGRVMAEAEASFKAGVINKATLSTYSNELAGSEGGFAIPPEFRTGIMNRIEGGETLMSLCDRATLTGNTLTAAIDDTTPWQTSGGILCYWEQEAGAITQSKLSLKERTWRLRKLTALCPLTDELAQDAGFLGSYIARKAGDKLAFAADKAILEGTGVGQPLGVLGHAGTVSVAKETSQTAATIKANNIQKMWMRLEPGARRNAVWVVNPDCQVQLQRMFVQGLTDAGTAVAAGSLVYLPANGLAGNPNETLMGRRIIFHQACQTLGTVGDIYVGDFSQYLVCTKAAGVESASSIHLWFDQGVAALRFVMRIDGQPWYPSTIAALNGSTTYGSFCTLATRS